MARSLAVIFFLCFFQNVFAQVEVINEDQVEILDAANLRFKKLPDGTEVQVLSGGVKLRQGTTIFSCDSCVVNNSLNLFEAFGSVHINDSDTAHVYSNYLRYLTDKRMAYLTKSVRLTDGHGVLTTNDLEYDVVNRIGTYKNGGKVVNKKSVLTSKEGIYYADLHDIYFKNTVNLKDPAYNLKSDSLLYNTETQVATFIAETFIRDSSGRTIKTSQGYYDLVNRKAQFSARTDIQDKSLFASADEVINDNAQNITQLKGRAIMRDTAEGHSVLADEIFINNKTKAFLATRKPVMLIEQDNDSIYVAADTLFSARITDLYPTDSVRKLFKNEEDSTNRYFEAYRNVRVFSDSVQAVSDSLIYSFKDSIFQLYYDPVVWNNKSQVTADTIFLYTKNKKANRFRAIENSFLVNEIEPGVYNQIKSSRMEGLFTEGSIDSVRARGQAESVYFLQDEDSAYTSANQTSSDVIDIYFLKGELEKVVLRSSVKGTLWPISQKSPAELQLEKFRWLMNRRPKTRYELFE
jgi:lipopolysaccharide export system protein LptA